MPSMLYTITSVHSKHLSLVDKRVIHCIDSIILLAQVIQLCNLAILPEVLCDLGFVSYIILQ